MEGYPWRIQNGMALDNPTKIERFMAILLRSDIFNKKFPKTLGGHLGH